MTVPPGVIRPIRLPVCSVNQRLPSGPVAMPNGPLLAVMTENSVIVPRGVMRPILCRSCLSEPEIAVRPRRDAVRAAACGEEWDTQ